MSIENKVIVDYDNVIEPNNTYERLALVCRYDVEENGIVKHKKEVLNIFKGEISLVDNNLVLNKSIDFPDLITTVLFYGKLGEFWNETSELSIEPVLVTTSHRYESMNITNMNSRCEFGCENAVWCDCNMFIKVAIQFTDGDFNYYIGEFWNGDLVISAYLNRPKNLNGVLKDKLQIGTTIINENNEVTDEEPIYIYPWSKEENYKGYKEASKKYFTKDIYDKINESVDNIWVV